MFWIAVGEKTPFFVCSSTVTLGLEFLDAACNSRDFAIRLYKREGNYDTVGLNFGSMLFLRPCVG